MWVQFKVRCKYHQKCNGLKALNNLTLEYVKELIHIWENRNRSSFNKNVIHYRQYHKHFKHRWHGRIMKKLPKNIKTSFTIGPFKNRLITVIWWFGNLTKYVCLSMFFYSSLRPGSVYWPCWDLSKFELLALKSQFMKLLHTISSQSL